jgi:hypothetical protein
MRVKANAARIIVVAVAAIVTVMFVTGIADDRAPPGSGGRVPVTDTGTNDSLEQPPATIPGSRSGPTQRFRFAAVSRCLRRRRGH